MQVEITATPESSSIASISYDGQHGTLGILYKNTPTLYYYYSVPYKTYQELLSASSKGKFINSHIKPFYEYNKANQVS